MRNILLTILVLSLTGFSSRENHVIPFSVHILYTGLPSGTHYDYFITNERMTLRKYFHAIGDRPEIVEDRASFKLKQVDSLVNHIAQTDWTKMPKDTNKGWILLLPNNNAVPRHVQF